MPTGPPIKVPPHNLKGEAAEWVDNKLQEEVARGQLERGTSAWGSPPFPTKEFADHRKQRKRRIVVDYRRVNARTLRSVYFVRNAAGVVADAAGSLWLTLLDAVTGFNHVVNTDRARKMLAILARSGQFLPRCLTFGPHNGPEDFCYVVDRFYSPGRRAKRRFCKEWLAYVDDLTIRTGRVLDGVHYTDAEHEARLAEAAARADLAGYQDAQEALEAQGFLAKDLGMENKGSKKATSSNTTTPTASSSTATSSSSYQYRSSRYMGRLGMMMTAVACLSGSVEGSRVVEWGSSSREQQECSDQRSMQSGLLRAVGSSWRGASGAGADRGLFSPLCLGESSSSGAGSSLSCSSSRVCCLANSMPNPQTHGVPVPPWQQQSAGSSSSSGAGGESSFADAPWRTGRGKGKGKGKEKARGPQEATRGPSAEGAFGPPATGAVRSPSPPRRAGCNGVAAKEAVGRRSGRVRIVSRTGASCTTQVRSS